MKTMLLLFMLTFIQPCPAQDNLYISLQQLKKPLIPTVFFEPAGGHQNFVMNYLRTINHKKLSNFLYHQPTKQKSLVISCCKTPTSLFVINKAWLRYYLNAETGNEKAEKLTSAAGGTYGLFFGAVQYSKQESVLRELTG